jgi:transposase
MYSIDFKKIALSMYKKFNNYRRVCSLLKISLSTLSLWRSKGIKRTKRIFKSIKLTQKVLKCARDFIQQNPFTTLLHVQKYLQLHINIRISLKSIQKILKIIQFTKKKAYHYNKKKNVIKEIFFKEQLNKYKNKKLYSLDECYFSSKVLPNYGYSKKGERLSTTLMPNSYPKKSLLLAICNDGTFVAKIYDKNINKEKFKDFLEEIPTDEHFIILDNVPFHHSIKKENFIFTPPYEPKYNPVELCFSQIKRVFRYLNSCNLTDSIETMINLSLNQVSNSNIQNYFKHILNLI